MLDYIRIACAVPPVKVGDVEIRQMNSGRISCCCRSLL